MIERVQQEWQDLTGRGWRTRVLQMGVLMAVGVGVPVGVLLASSLPPVDVPGGGVLLGTLAFTGLTLLWTLPAAFGMRWMSTRGFRSYVVRENKGDAMER